MDETAEDIVREIASDEYPSDSNTEEWHCTYCGSYPGALLVDGYATEEERLDPAVHPETCLWRRSKEWVVAQERELGHINSETENNDE